MFIVISDRFCGDSELLQQQHQSARRQQPQLDRSKSLYALLHSSHVTRDCHACVRSLRWCTAWPGASEQFRRAPSPTDTNINNAAHQRLGHRRVAVDRDVRIRQISGRSGWVLACAPVVDRTGGSMFPSVLQMCVLLRLRSPFMLHLTIISLTLILCLGSPQSSYRLVWRFVFLPGLLFVTPCKKTILWIFKYFIEIGIGRYRYLYYDLKVIFFTN